MTEIFTQNMSDEKFMHYIRTRDPAIRLTFEEIRRREQIQFPSEPEQYIAKAVDDVIAKFNSKDKDSFKVSVCKLYDAIAYRGQLRGWRDIIKEKYLDIAENIFREKGWQVEYSEYYEWRLPQLHPLYGAKYYIMELTKSKTISA